MSSGDDPDEVLRAAADAWHRSSSPAGSAETYAKWSVPGGYTITGGTLGSPGADFVVWVAAAVGSGALGNAAYDGLKALVRGVRDRRRAVGAPLLTAADVAFLARLAVRVALIDSGDEMPPGSEVVLADARYEPGDDGRGQWRIEAHGQRRWFGFTLPDRPPQDVLVRGRSDGPGPLSHG